MKHLATAFAVCVLLVGASSVYAIDFVWDGFPSDLWHDGSNWGAPAASFPGSGAPCRVIDRALHNTNTDNDIIRYDGDSGGGNCDCRTIVEFYMDAGRAGVPLELWMTENAARDDEDDLYVTQFFMISGANGAATLDVDYGTLLIDYLFITGHSDNSAVLDFEVDVDPGFTTIEGDTDIDVLGGKTFDIGGLMITGVSGDTTVTKTGTGVAHTS